jgi:cupin 2 domain-containing protein
MTVELAHIFSSIPSYVSEEIVETLVRRDKVKIERILSKGQSSPASGWYDQEDNEWMIVLKGEAKIVLENDSAIHLKVGDYLNIPAHTKHRVEWTPADTETVWLAIHYQ